MEFGVLGWFSGAHLIAGVISQGTGVIVGFVVKLVGSIHK